MSKKFSPNFFIQSYYLFERWHTWVILRWPRVSACLAIMGKFLKYEVLQKPNFSGEGTINCPWSLCRFMTSFWHVSDLESVDLAPPCSESHSVYRPSDDLIEKFVVFARSIALEIASAMWKYASIGLLMPWTSVTEEFENTIPAKVLQA